MPLTRLESFVRSRGIKPALLARESGYSREQLYRIRMGKSTPSLRGVAAIVAACRRLTHEPLRTEDLFEMTGDE